MRTLFAVLITIILMTLYTNHQKKLAVTSAYWSGYQVNNMGVK